MPTPWGRGGVMGVRADGEKQFFLTIWGDPHHANPLPPGAGGGGWGSPKIWKNCFSPSSPGGTPIMPAPVGGGGDNGGPPKSGKTVSHHPHQIPPNWGDNCATTATRGGGG